MIELRFTLREFALILTILNLFAEEIETSPFIAERPDNPANCLTIVTRREWKARNATAKYTPMVYTPAPYVVVHHGGIRSYCYNENKCAGIVRSYQNLHIDVNGWIDIGYHFVIGEDGNVYEGRGWDNVGAHAPGYNTQGIGICVIGDFTQFLPSEKALGALTSLIQFGIGLGKIREDYRVIGHRQARATECPGETFYKWIQNMPHWTAHPVPIYNNSTNVSSNTSNVDTNVDNPVDANLLKETLK